MRGGRNGGKFLTFAVFDFRFAYIATMRALGWTKVASLTQDGLKYSDYITTLQDEFQKYDIEFLMNRKFPKQTSDMRMVSRFSPLFSLLATVNQ